MTSTIEQLDILFAAEGGFWPMDQGYRLRGINVAQALTEQGYRVGLTSIVSPFVNSDSTSSIPLQLSNLYKPCPTASIIEAERMMKSWKMGKAGYARQRVAEHQGVSPVQFANLLPLIERYQPKAVVGLGQHAPMFLQSVKRLYPSMRTAWYAADDPTRFELSCLKREGLEKLTTRGRMAVVYAMMQRLFTEGLDLSVTNNAADARWMRRVNRSKQVVTIRNGVDLDYYRVDLERKREPKSLVFWGRMDFEPNVDAVCHFVKTAWPQLKQKHPEATFTIVGKHPVDAVIALAKQPSIEVTGGVADVRTYAQQAAVTILPMRCGGGLKNKLLEAGAMGNAIVVTECATEGLDSETYADTSKPNSCKEKASGHSRPFVVARCVTSMIRHIDQLWQNEERCVELGQAARQWVERHHTWNNTTNQLIQALKLPSSQKLADRIAA